MADEQILYRNLTSLLESLSPAHLIEIARQASLGGFKAACQMFLKGQTLEAVLAQLFPDFSEERIAATAQEIGLCAMRNRCWSQMLSLPDAFKVQIRCPNPKRAQALRERTGPVILAYWHLGASFMMGLGMQRVGVTGLIVAQHQPPAWFRRAVSPGTRMAAIGNDPRNAVLALKQSLDELRGGGIVALALDGRQGQRDLTVPFLGRKIFLRRGMAVLSRLTGAPIIPCGVTWGEKDWSLDFRLFEPLALPDRATVPPDEWEDQVLTEAARRFEGMIRAFPGQIRLDRLAIFVDAPPA